MNSRNAVLGAGSLFCAAGVVLAVAGGAQAAPNPPGNNGDVKVHELGAPAHTESNQPHVCKFNLEYYNQDDNQPGFVAKFTNQAPTKPKGALALSLTMPPADANGYSESVYVNADPQSETDGLTLPDGHYKVTIYGKDGVTVDKKAKTKVFWVKCAASTTPPVTTPPTSTPPVTTPPVTTPPASTTTPPPTGTTNPPSTGPVVVTDGPSGGNGNNNGLIGGGLAAVGLTLAGAGLLRRRMTR